MNLKSQKKDSEALREEVTARELKDDEHYAELQKGIEKDIEVLKKSEDEFYDWFSKVSSILLPLTE